MNKIEFTVTVDATELMKLLRGNEKATTSQKAEPPVKKKAKRSPKKENVQVEQASKDISEADIRKTVMDTMQKLETTGVENPVKLVVQELRKVCGKTKVSEIDKTDYEKVTKALTVLGDEYEQPE